MTKESLAVRPNKVWGWPFLALLFVIAFTYACSIYANCSYVIIDRESFRFLPPFKPHVNENMNDHLGAEYFNIARSLANGQGFSNPFPEPTGPTAWMPPALSVLEAGFLRACDNDKDLVTAIVVLLQVNVLIGTGLLVLALTWQTIPRGWPVVAASVFCLGLVYEFHSHFQFTHDSWLILLMVDLLMAGLCWFRPLQSWQRASVWGLFGGLCALVNPIVAMVWGICSAVMSLKQRSWLAMGAAVLVAGITLLPWTVRNYAVLGRWIPVKSNLAYELYQSQCLQPDGLLQQSTFGTHPYASSGRERQEYKAAGEISFLEHKSKQFWDAVWADPRDFIQRVVTRFLGATVWYQPFKRDEGLQRPIVFWLSRLAMPLPFLGLFVLIFSAIFVRLPAAQWIVMGVYVLYLLPYVGVSYYERYAIPLLAVKVLLVIWGADRLLCLVRYGVSVFAGGRAIAKPPRALQTAST